MRLQLHHIALICSDYAASKAFYLSLPGITLINEYYRTERNSWKADLALNGVYLLELFSFPNPPARLSYPEASGLRHLAFAVESVAGMHAFCQQKGYQPEAIRKDEHTGKAFFFVADPDGLPLEFYETA